MEPEFLKQISLGRFHEIAPVVEIAQTVAQPGGELVELIQKWLRREAGKLNGGEIESRPVKPDFGRVVLFQELPKIVHADY